MVGGIEGDGWVLAENRDGRLMVVATPGGRFADDFEAFCYVRDEALRDATCGKACGLHGTMGVAARGRARGDASGRRMRGIRGRLEPASGEEPCPLPGDVGELMEVVEDLETMLVQVCLDPPGGWGDRGAGAAEALAAGAAHCLAVGRGHASWGTRKGIGPGESGCRAIADVAAMAMDHAAKAGIVLDDDARRSVGEALEVASAWIDEGTAASLRARLRVPAG